MANFARVVPEKEPMSVRRLETALLIIAGIMLAFALFAAGVLWHSRAGS
jgi:hypothetical protein